MNRTPGWLVVVCAFLAFTACSDDDPLGVDAGGDTGPQELDADVEPEDTNAVSDADAGESVDLGADPDADATTEPDADATTDADATIETDADNDTDASEGLPFALNCEEPTDGSVNFEFEIDSSTAAYTVVPFAADEQSWIDPQSITAPSGAVIDFQGENHFQIYGLEYEGFEWSNAMTIPAAPNYESQLESGPHEFAVDTAADELCYYLLETEGGPTLLDLNIYLVGLDDIGLTASTAATHDDFQSILASVDEIFEQAGIALGEIRYMELEQSVVDEYRVIYEEWDIYELIAHSEYPGEDSDSALSVNLFITEQFVYEAIGLAMGIPGIPGYHESLVSGIALTGQYIGDNADDNLFTAIAIAHEVGHFLGLFHTSETDGQTHDGLDDTPECTNLNAYWNCPDVDNVMFPYIDYGTVELTPDQSYVMHVNPLTK